MLNHKKYKKPIIIDFPERQWPNKEIEKAPIWCSVDLRDGNQALIEPMTVEEKVEFFQMLVDIGFKEIEVGFPAASQIEFDFLRELVNRNLIPDDVTIQVLVQCREHLLERTFESLEGIKKSIVHIYNSTSPIQREVVFNKNKDEIKQIAIDGTRMVKEYVKDFDGSVTLEYSPESFSATELDFALEICNAVQSEWGPTKTNKMIINLPSTVEINTPNVYADQIEWMSTRLDNRESIILSVHTHNDRGTGVASTELALLAGADRVEGTLFGNGERTGNVDILNLAGNMYASGVDPELDISNVNKMIEVFERCCKMPVPNRLPYAGKLVFTAFSGSHQDAINKGIDAMKKRADGYWDVPYLPIDPADLGRDYEPVVRINSQSGKGGIAFVMDYYFGYKLPKAMHKEFADVIQGISESQGEVTPDQIMDEFKVEYIEMKEPYHFRKSKFEDVPDTDNENKYCSLAHIEYTAFGEHKVFESVGNGPINAVLGGLQKELGINLKVQDYYEHALTEGSHAHAAAYIQLVNPDNGKTVFGVGTSSNITRASIRAIFSAINRIYHKKI